MLERRLNGSNLVDGDEPQSEDCLWMLSAEAGRPKWALVDLETSKVEICEGGPRGDSSVSRSKASAPCQAVILWKSPCEGDILVVEDSIQYQNTKDC